MKYLRVLFVVPRMSYGGTERQIAIISSELARRGHLVLIYSMYCEESKYDLDNAVIFIKGKTEKKEKNIIQVIGTLKKTLSQYSPDVVVPFFLIPIICTFIVKTVNKTFKIVTSERCDPNAYSMVKNNILKIAYKNSDGFVCQSRRVSEYYRDISKTKKRIIPNAVYPNNAIEEQNKNHTIIAVGRIEYQKRFDVLLNAIDMIKDDIRSFSVHVYGDGSKKDELSGMIKKLKLSDMFFLEGTTNSLDSEMKKAHICVISSDYEGFPNVMIEAMSAGIPVVTTDFSPGNASEILGDAGIVVNKGDSIALGKAIKEIISDNEKRELMGQFGLSRSKEYSVLKVCDEWEKLFFDVVKR